MTHHTSAQAPAAASDRPATHRAEVLGDFRTDRRVLLLALLAVPTGLISALIAKALLWLIALFTNLAFFQRLSVAPVEAQDNTLGLWTIVVPVAGALIIGLMARFGSEKIRGHGIPEALEAILLGRSLISPRVAVLKPISSAVSIGTGGPFGAEGPIIMTGGAFGSVFAQLFHLTAQERKTLLVAGAAGGMAAVFATPVAAVLLAVELLLFEWKPRSFIPVTVSALIASAARVPILGAGPLFGVAPHAQVPAGILAASCAVGILVGFGSGLLTVLVYAVEDGFARLRLHWMWWPAIGAVAVGVGGVIDPRVLGVGYGTIHELLAGHLVGMAVVSLMLAKGIVWAVSLGSGTSGGVLAPLLMIGGSLGVVIGAIVPGGDPSLWAMVGMAAMMGGTMRSPLTGMIFVLELTHDFNALPALLVSTCSALCVTVLLMRRSILTEKLSRRGHHIAREYSVDVFESMRVADAMDRTVPTVPATLPVSDLAERLANNDPAVCRHHAIVLVDADQRLEGIITRGDVMRALAGPDARDASVLAAGSRTVHVTHPDETVYHAAALLLQRDVGRLVVVDRADPRRIVGYLGRREILAARQRHHREELLRERGPLLNPAR